MDRVGSTTIVTLLFSWLKELCSIRVYRDEMKCVFPTYSQIHGSKTFQNFIDDFIGTFNIEIATTSICEYGSYDEVDH